jgi:predicted enzyme related to lactoylglutathione lyase
MILDHLIVPVSDPVRACAFYERVFGFISMTHEEKAANDNGGIDMRAPGAALAVTLVSPDAGLPLGSVQGAVLMVGDLGTARRHIEAQGVKPGPTELGQGGPYFSLTDPDGNGWIIRQT